MRNEHGPRFYGITSASSPLSTAVLLCLVIALSYLAPKLVGAMILNPRTVWPFWPGSAILVSVLLLVPGRIWPILIPAAFATFALYDLEAGVPVKSIAWFIPANTLQVVASGLCLRYYFHGIPRLDSLKALAKYSLVAVILAPGAAAFFSAFGIGGDYWDGWKVCFLSEALAFATLTPAILVWLSEGSAFARKPRAYRLEAVALTAGLTLLSYIIFDMSRKIDSPALLYSLIPFLLWAALRFGSIGITSSTVLVSFLTIWGAVHGRGPFAEQSSLNGILSLQLFLVLAVIPFMVLAALVEERKVTLRELALSNERFRLAMDAGSSVAWDLAVGTGQNVWIGNLETLFGISPDTYAPSAADFILYIHPDDRQRVSQALHDARQNRNMYALEFRIARPDGLIRWLATRGNFYYSADDEPERMLGVSLDITDRKLAEQAVKESEERFRLAARAGKMFAYEWDAATDVIVRSAESAQILGIDETATVTGQQILTKVHPDDRERLKTAVAELSPEEPKLLVRYRMVRPDNTVIWVERSSRAHFDERGGMVRIVGMVADITQRKQAEDALASVGRRLIEAQEQERSRIARELHDDISQRLALVTGELEVLHKDPANLSQVLGRIRELWKRASEITTDIQSLSHELHSSKLEYLGLAPAIRGFCKEFCEQQNVEIDFQTHDLPSPLPPDASLCVFRVLQEALHNAAKHSGARHFEVRLWGTPGEFHLTVRDSGTGFNREAAKESRGLGLISMEERLKLVNGSLSIDSQPERRGTTIHARVPIRSLSSPLRSIA
jgi:PAS domain S-box-containing protein